LADRPYAVFVSDVKVEDTTWDHPITVPLFNPFSPSKAHFNMPGKYLDIRRFINIFGEYLDSFKTEVRLVPRWSVIDDTFRSNFDDIAKERCSPFVWLFKRSRDAERAHVKAVTLVTFKRLLGQDVEVAPPVDPTASCKVQPVAGNRHDDHSESRIAHHIVRHSFARSGSTITENIVGRHSKHTNALVF
jgi:hypothetical protein